MFENHKSQINKTYFFFHFLDAPLSRMFGAVALFSPPLHATALLSVKNRWVSHKNGYFLRAKKWLFFGWTVRFFRESPQFKTVFIISSQNLSNGSKKMSPYFSQSTQQQRTLLMSQRYAPKHAILQCRFPNLSLNMYPFSTPTDEHVSL